MEFNKQNLEYLIEDATYLQDEIEALKYVIHDIPFDEKPGDEDSIIEMIALIDHAQLTYYRPILETFRSAKNPNFSNIKPDFRRSFQFGLSEELTVDKVLNKIIKHRAALLNIAHDIPVIAWQKKGILNGEEISLFDIFQEMIVFERNQLKKVADRVMALGSERKN
ncbi:MAG TPA: hypothetical protein VJ991_14945 [Balneolales bacterium]|nr:hypothetical protein [Balneolales bacterium]